MDTIINDSDRDTLSRDVSIPHPRHVDVHSLCYLVPLKQQREIGKLESPTYYLVCHLEI